MRSIFRITFEIIRINLRHSREVALGHALDRTILETTRIELHPVQLQADCLALHLVKV